MVECSPLLNWLYVAVKVYLEEGVKKMKNQPCTKVELVDYLRKIESNILTQAIESYEKLSRSLAAPLEQLDDVSRSTQETISKWASYQLQEKTSQKNPSASFQWITRECF